MAVQDLFHPDGDDAVIVAVHAQPGAGRTELVGRHGAAVKIRVAAPPEGGRANEALTAVLAERLGVPAKAITIASGATSRSKRFRIGGIAPDEFADRLERALSQAGGPAGRSGPPR